MTHKALDLRGLPASEHPRQPRLCPRQSVWCPVLHRPLTCCSFRFFPNEKCIYLSSAGGWWRNFTTSASLLFFSGIEPFGAPARSLLFRVCEVSSSRRHHLARKNQENRGNRNENVYICSASPFLNAMLEHITHSNLRLLNNSVTFPSSH